LRPFRIVQIAALFRPPQPASAPSLFAVIRKQLG
jgi:hypothetical protein